MKQLIHLWWVIFVLILLTMNQIIAQQSDTNFCGFSAASQAFKQNEPYSRPVLPDEQIYTTMHFKIHYTFTYPHRSYNTASVHKVGEYAEYCWLGLYNRDWLMPPSDTGGGDALYDIYLWDVSTQRDGCLGLTCKEAPYQNSYPNGYTSWMEIDADLTFDYSEPRLRTLVAHEFHHAVQFRYSGIEGIWFHENCSAYFEEVLYDNDDMLKWYCRT